MSKNFINFRRKVRTEAIASALMIGLGSAIIAFAALMITFKLSAKILPPYFYGVLGGGAAVLSAILYFAFTPSDERLAKRLDSVYSLDEKISTMVELRDSDEGIVTLQREDADEKLGEKPIKQLRSKQLIAAIVVFAIALGSLTAALIVPSKADPKEESIGTFDKQWIITTLNELITSVEKANYIDDSLRTSTLRELRSLLSFVEQSDLLSEMKREAVKTVIAINSALTRANSAEAFAKQFAGSQDKNISTLGKEMADLASSGSQKALEALGKAIDESEEDDAVFMADELDSYLMASGVRTDDTLYLLFKSLISTVKNNPLDVGIEFKSAAQIVSATVLMQNMNKATISPVIKKLCNLFGITENDLTAQDPDSNIEIGTPSDGNQDPEDPGVEDPDINIGTGGIGTGDVIYGSNDIIYDPYTNTYRPYGEIINEYFAKVTEYITDGKTSEEIANALQEYFDMLLSGAKKQN